MKSLVRWISAMQGGGFDMGGFRGRTNKLVDGCYSWWVGSCFPLLEALGISLVREKVPDQNYADHTDEDWDDVDGMFLSQT
jgi:protein farnesyltransferase subunit beta